MGGDTGKIIKASWSDCDFVKNKKEDRSKWKKSEQNPTLKKLCFQAFYWATDKIVQITGTEIYDAIAFLSSLTKFLGACSVKHLSNTGKS